MTKLRLLLNHRIKLFLILKKNTINFPLVMKLENENKCLKMHFYKKTRHISWHHDTMSCLSLSLNMFSIFECHNETKLFSIPYLRTKKNGKFKPAQIMRCFIFLFIIEYVLVTTWFRECFGVKSHFPSTWIRNDIMNQAVKKQKNNLCSNVN